MPSHARSVSPPLALLLLYATSGMLWGAWIQRLPVVTRHLELTNAQLGIVLPALPIGAIVAFQLVSILSNRFQSRTTLIAFGLQRAAVFPLLGLATDGPTLMAALALSGFAHGGLEVSLNRQGIAVERLLGRPILARGAAANSIGTLVSAGGIWLGTRAGLPYIGPFLIAAIVGLVMFAIFRPYLIDDDGPRAAAVPAMRPARSRWMPPPALWMLLVVAFIAELLDETISEWLNIYLENDLETGPAITTLGYSLYTSALLAGRLVGDTVSRHVSPIRILQVGGLVAGAGMLIGVGINTENAILLTTGVIGLGTSLVLPTIFRLAGATPGMPCTQALAMVSTTTYLGYMVGPMVIGPLSDSISLRAALVCVGIICFGIPVVAGMARVPAPTPEPAVAQEKYA
jgi:predicted MFS family arabinose efflux permease